MTETETTQVPRRNGRELKHPWIETLEPGQEHMIEGGTHTCREFKTVQAYAWRRGWKLQTCLYPEGLKVTRLS